MNIFIATLYFFAFLTYHIVESFILAFIPRRLKGKKDLQGQKILITGAGSGVGRQLAIEFSKHSVCLVLLDINRQSLMNTEKLLDRRSTVFFYDCDVSNRRKVYEIADKIKKDVGDMDIVVNNAGIVSGDYLMDIPDEKIVKTMEVNALAHFWVVKSFLPAMMAKNRGHIVSTASIAGRFVVPKLTDYCASKFAAVGFAECLEMELREKKLDGIKVTIVCPSHIDTGLFEGTKVALGSIMSPEYVAREVVMAVQEEKETLYLPHFFNRLVKLKHFLPRRLSIKLFEITGNMKVMENFTGRNNAQKKKE